VAPLKRPCAPGDSAETDSLAGSPACSAGIESKKCHAPIPCTASILLCAILPNLIAYLPVIRCNKIKAAAWYCDCFHLVTVACAVMVELMQ